MPDDDVQELQAAEQRWMQAVMDRDLATLREVLAPEFRMVSTRTDEYSSRDFYLAMVDVVTLREFTFEDVDVDLFGDAAVVRCRYAQQGSVHDQDWSGRFVFTDVWVRRDGRWQVVARHSSHPPHKPFEQA